MSSDVLLHPALVLMLGALLLPWLRGAVRNAVVLLAPLIALVALWQLPEGRLWQVNWLDYTLAPLVVDKLSRLFATIFLVMAFGGGLFALRQQSRAEVPAAFLYAGSAVGVTLAGDLVTVFLFWEFMAVGSTLVIWSAGTPGAWAASRRYVAVHLAGGVILFAGIAGQIATTGDASFHAMQADSLATWLILIGFLINAAAPPLSAWLPDAYPEASWSGTVFLSAFTTKTAVYVLLRGFPGTEILIWVGIFMIFYGIVYALSENDMRRSLSYSIINQVGFSLAAIGLGSELALNGAASQSVMGVFYVSVLTMVAGTIIAATGKRKFSELGGLFRSMPVTAICAATGALAISAFPFTSGFVSKSMINTAAAQEHLLAVWLLLSAGSAGVILHAGLKFPWFVFFHKDSGLRPADPPASLRWAMIFFAFLCIAPGVWPDPFYAMLPYEVNYVPYTAAHVITQLQLLLFSGLAFFVMLNYLKRTPSITLDTDWFWRVPLAAMTRAVHAAWRGLSAMLAARAAKMSAYVEDRVLHQRRPGGLLLRSWPTGVMAIWVMIVLLANLLFYYLG